MLRKRYDFTACKFTTYLYVPLYKEKLQNKV